MTRSTEPGRADCLSAAMDAFLASGFHATTIENLEAVTGLSWESVRERYGDKEGLFFAATEARLQKLASGGAGDSSAAAATIVEMLSRVRAAGFNVRLRVQHRQALERLMLLAEAEAQKA